MLFYMCVSRYNDTEFIISKVLQFSHKSSNNIIHQVSLIGYTKESHVKNVDRP